MAGQFLSNYGWAPDWIHRSQAGNQSRYLLVRHQPADTAGEIGPVGNLHWEISSQFNGSLEQSFLPAACCCWVQARLESLHCLPLRGTFLTFTTHGRSGSPAPRRLHPSFSIGALQKLGSSPGRFCGGRSRKGVHDHVQERYVVVGVGLNWSRRTSGVGAQYS